MKDMRDTFEPTVDDLFEALEPLRAEPETLAAGIAAGIDERQPDHDDSTALSAASKPEGNWPAWMRRAASIAPSGAMGALGVAKASSAKLGTAAAGVGWATPFAALFMGGLGLFAATFRLRGDRGDEGLDKIRKWTKLLFPWLFLLGMSGGVWLMFQIGPRAMGIAMMCLQVVATIVIVRVMSAVGKANRMLLCGALAAYFVEVAMFHLFFVAQGERAMSLSRVAAPCLLAAAAWVLQGIARRAGWEGDALKSARARLGAFGLLAVVVIGASVVMQCVLRKVAFGSSTSSIVKWVNTVDAPADDLGTWKSLGHAALALEPEAMEHVDFDRLRASIASAGKRVHPTVALGALRLGVFPEAEYGRSVGDYWTKRPRFTGQQMGYAGTVWLKIEYLKARGEFNGELRDDARRLLESSWPAVDAFMSLEKAVHVLEVAEAAGFDDLVAEKLPELPALLEAAWVGRRLAAFEDCGFEALHVQEDGKLSRPEISSNVGTSFAATVLMARLVDQAPDALGGLDVELTTFLRYLDAQRKYFTRLGAHATPRDAGLARHLLLRTAPLPRPSPSVWIWRHFILLSTLATCAIAVAAVARAPSSVAIWDGP